MKTIKSTIRLVALVPYPVGTTPSQRFRIEQWAPLLRQQGIQIDFFPFADASFYEQLYRIGNQFPKIISTAERFACRIRDVVKSRKYDIAIVHRALSIAGPAILESILARIGPPIIYDFDDAIFHSHASQANRWFSWLKAPRKTATICRISSQVVVGNSYLADYAKEQNLNVTVIPTSIDINKYSPAAKDRLNGRLIIGWTGSSTSQTHLEMFAPVLKEFLAKRDVEVRVISNRKPQLPGVKHTWREWAPETEVREIGEFDIGIMPMPDDKWAKGKCALKALQYMSMSIPTVASAVGANNEVISHGENGLLATTDEDWINQLSELVDSPSLRARLGNSGRRTVEEKYSTEHCAAMFAEVVRKIVK